MQNNGRRCGSLGYGCREEELCFEISLMELLERRMMNDGRRWRDKFSARDRSGKIDVAPGMSAKRDAEGIPITWKGQPPPPCVNFNPSPE
jgi:hypothetical protein